MSGGYFRDNQQMMKAYDRYFNQMAKSDFVQGRKLKALIEKEHLDDASVEQIATLFQKAVSRSRDYDYDRITQKLLRKAPEVLKGVEQMMNAAASSATPKKGKKFIHVPEVTDTDVNMATSPQSRKGSPKKKASTTDENDVTMSPAPKFPLTMNIRKNAPEALPTADGKDEYLGSLFGADGSKAEPKTVQRKLEAVGAIPDIEDAIDKISNEVTRESVKSRTSNVMERLDARLEEKRQAARRIQQFMRRNKFKGLTPDERALIAGQMVKNVQANIDEDMGRNEQRKSVKDLDLSTDNKGNVSSLQKLARQAVVNNARAKIAASKIKKAYIRKRGRTDSSSPSKVDDRDPKFYKQDKSIERRLDLDDQSDSDDEETQAELKEEKRLNETNDKVKAYYRKLIDESSSNNSTLLKEIKKSFKSAVDARRGKGYFDSDHPKPSMFSGGTPEGKESFRKELKGWLDGIFIEPPKKGAKSTPRKSKPKSRRQITQAQMDAMHA